ncbi:hypothetical protein NM208_g14937 [Fusarium decemcellulare]|uniref:Uncharacterized protein n=1 Tax=Fusarium decemcellulare TaxID=57161 RepID=A0ACC1RHY8_9HYPO|nr:hypothetical protein NM208_g14937 [Fusarium decemcellulare]
MGFFVKLKVGLGSAALGELRLESELSCWVPKWERFFGSHHHTFLTCLVLHTPVDDKHISDKMAPAAGAKKQKKKWSKGKVKDKAQHAVILDKSTSEKLYKDVQSYRLVTIATLVDRMKINGSLARQCLADLEEKGMIKPVVTHSKMKIYTRAVGASD